MVMRPSFVSNETSFAVLAIVPRKFLERVVPHCERVTRIGKTVLVELEEAERVIRELGAIESGSESETEASPGREPKSIDDVLRAIGRERAS